MGALSWVLGTQKPDLYMYKYFGGRPKSDVSSSLKTMIQKKLLCNKMGRNLACGRQNGQRKMGGSSQMGGMGCDSEILPKRLFLKIDFFFWKC